jgi:hypothetical protein
MKDYLLTLQNGKVERWEASTFHQWLTDHQERVSATVKGRLDQLRRYTQEDVIDWELED